MTLYEGSFLNFNYQKEFNTELEFEDWLHTKLERYRFKPMEKRILQKLLGMDILKDRIDQLEEILRRNGLK